jgi:hypothetical protein
MTVLDAFAYWLRLVFHDYLLSMWGTPLGESWDLEKLAETCAKLGQYSFSSPVPL